MGSVSCSRSNSGMARFDAVWGMPVPSSLVIIKTVENEGGNYYAVFAKLPKVDFEAFKKGTSRYTTWNRIEDGMTFEIGKTNLRAPADISGVYAIGEKINGTVKVVVWDEGAETVVAMVCSGMM
ncbi:MAG: hypothetical protein NZM04_02355 [Methylacidiphilales bacterium]|nr:hypothetical protein [Candidatus Methylacidiphilales bacterium]MDW8350255.1 hypothetical protein [Verrucomicrobiae bacterium]